MMRSRRYIYLLKGFLESQLTFSIGKDLIKDKHLMFNCNGIHAPAGGVNELLAAFPEPSYWHEGESAYI